MSFITTIIDDHLADFSGSLSYFDREGNVHGVTHGSKTSYPSFEDYYLAMGARISSEVQSKYTRKLRFWAFWEAIQFPSIALSLFIGLISLVLFFITKGEGWPEGLVNIAMFFTISPLFGYIYYNLFFKTWATTNFENAYYRELAKKQSTIYTKKVKREKNWPFIIAVVGLLALGYFDSWTTSVKLLLMGLIPLLLSMIEGVILIVLIKLFATLFPKKKKETSDDLQRLSPELDKELKKRLRTIYVDFQKGKYADAFKRFDTSQKSWKEFHQEIQNFLNDQELTAFHTIPFEETEISILNVTASDFEADLFLYDTQAIEFPEFYLICKVSYQEDRLQAIELVEIGY
ncbi:hypothetical protein ACTGV0_00545 [Streptococcus suis]